MFNTREYFVDAGYQSRSFNENYNDISCQEKEDVSTVTHDGGNRACAMVRHCATASFNMDSTVGYACASMPTQNPHYRAGMEVATDDEHFHFRAASQYWIFARSAVD